MDSPEQRRKRKRFLKPTKISSPLRHLPPPRSLFYCLCFFIFFFFIFRRHTSSFHHLASFPYLPTQLDSFHNLVKSPTHPTESTRFQLESRVSFPDHVLLIITTSTSNHQLYESLSETQTQFECLYRPNSSDSGLGPLDADVILKKSDVSMRMKVMEAMSVDGFGDDMVLVRCPLPPVNYSAPFALKRRRLVFSMDDDNNKNNKELKSWENLVYDVVLDGETVVVFVKGISHRQGKESDPGQFSCIFGSGEDIITTKAITAAQEVVRCVLPSNMNMNLNLNMNPEKEKTRGVPVTVSFQTPRFHGRVTRVVVPSVAKLKLPVSDFGLGVESVGSVGRVGKVGKKHELCVCTMLWNQAHSVREWVTYHSWLGVEKWFVYDNNSDDDIKTVVESLDNEGYNVSRHVWPWIKTQEAGFSHCALRAQRECNWVSFMDVDEFYYFPYNPVSGFASQGALRTLVSNFTASSSIGEVRTSCHSFGPSGLTSRPEQGVTVGYTCRLQSPERHKSIIRPDALDTTLMNVVHHFHLRKGFTFVDMPQSVAVINHYKYQVWEVFRAKFYRRVATYVADWTDNQNEGSRDRAPGLGTEAIEPPDWRLRFCEVWDTGLRDFVLANMGDVSTWWFAVR